MRLYLYSLIQWITLIDFCMLNQPCIPGINPFDKNVSYTVNYIDWFLYVKPTLHSWNKPIW